MFWPFIALGSFPCFVFWYTMAPVPNLIFFRANIILDMLETLALRYMQTHARSAMLRFPASFWQVEIYRDQETLWPRCLYVKPATKDFQKFM